MRRVQMVSQKSLLCGSKTFRHGITAALMGIIIFMTNLSYSCAQEIASPYAAQNPDTGYKVVIEDDADLLTREQEAALAEDMMDITAYGNVAFKTIDYNSTSAESYAKSYFKSQFGTKSGTVFLIDMDNRMLWIHSDGAIYRVITKSYANTITDNVYRDASAGDYYACASDVFEQIFTLLEGNRIAQPMKYISNILLAMILALLINFGFVSYFTRVRKTKDAEMLRKVEKHFDCSKPVATFTHQTKEYVGSSDSGGSSGGGGSGGGGGSSSGGGGGHSF